MSMIERSLDGMAALSGQLGAALQRRLRELCGIALISLAMMAALALATWSVQDPSLSHATDAPVHNLLGLPGAVAADLLMQLLGLGLAGAAAADRGVGLSAARPPAAQPRAAARSALARRRGVERPRSPRACRTARIGRCRPGLGGVVGDAVLRLPVMLLRTPLAGTIRFAAAFVFGIAALIAFAGAAGAIWREAPKTTRARNTNASDDDDERHGFRSAIWRICC